MSLLGLGKLAFAFTVSSEAVVQQLLRMGVKLALSSRKVDQETGEELVEAMEADAPERTGRLREGIETHEGEDGVTIVTASAVHGDWDYAPFVERGTEHMAAEPYFYDNVDAILGERAERLEDLAAEL